MIKCLVQKSRALQGLCSAVQCSAVQCTVASTIGLSLLRDLCVETALVVLGGQHDEATNEGAA